jgi:hypothetical protein
MKTGRIADEWPILVADDEDSYRRAVAQMLTRAAPSGAMEWRNGEEARMMRRISNAGPISIGSL